MPEPEGVLGEAPEAVYLVEVEEDLNDLPVQLKQATHLAVTTQTTLSQIDSVEDLTPALFTHKQRIAVPSGASTPSHITREVIHYIEGLPNTEISEMPTIEQEGAQT